LSNPNPSPATRFKPGDEWTGNPGGRPQGESFTTILREALAAGHKRAPTWRHALVAKAVLMAERGDLDALKWIADRTDGRVKEQVSVEQSGEVTIRVVRDRHTGAAPLRPAPDPTADPG
jgi:hypothetical protein